MILGCFNYKFYFFCIKIQFQKIVNLLDTTSDNKDLPKLVTKKWVEVYDQSQGNYYVNKEIRIKTLMLRSDLCDFSDAYIVAEGNIIVTKKSFTADNIEAPNNTAANAKLLMLQTIMRLVKKNRFLEIMLHLSIMFQKLMV